MGGCTIPDVDFVASLYGSRDATNGFRVFETTNWREDWLGLKA